MSEWQPIETAPTTGVRVLVYCGHEDICTAELRSFFVEDAEHGGTAMTYYYVASPQCADDDEPRPLVPTHWMPLPKPPGQ